MGMRQTAPTLTQRRGFTLVEVLVVIAVNTLILLGLVGIVQSFYANNSYTFAQANEVDSARRGIQAWERDFREATTAEDGTFPIEAAATSSMVFYTDLETVAGIERIEYRLATSTLEKRVYYPQGFPPAYPGTPDEVEVVSYAVQNRSLGLPLFTYYDTTGAVITNPSVRIGDIRYVSVELEVNVDPLFAPSGTRLQNSVAPRNLKDNL